MKKVIDLKDADIACDCTTNMNAANYPGFGLYRLKEDAINYYLVSGAGVWMVPQAQFVFEPDTLAEKNESAAIEDILKVMAVSHDPSLITEILKK